MGLKHTLHAQFSRPHGWLGRLAGIAMANRPSNRERTAWTIDLLDLRPTDRVLEIGFGPGLGIEAAARIVTQGRILGIDHSEVMLYQAAKRNAQAIAEGRVVLMLGSVFALPEFREPFDKIFSLNVVMFWDDPAAVFRALRPRLAPGGILITTFQPRHRGATNQDAVDMGRKMCLDLQQVGFGYVNLEVRQMQPVWAVCAIAVNG